MLLQQIKEQLNEWRHISATRLLAMIFFLNCCIVQYVTDTVQLRSKPQSGGAIAIRATANNRLKELEQCDHAAKGQSLACAKLKHAPLVILWRTGFCDLVRYVFSLCCCPSMNVLKHRRCFAMFLSCPRHADRIT